ncbi:iron-sulfur cluster assembly enzyme iscu [Anaeramoeba flamelloides]|uniref:Iron-sulfur cluster assembly protein n=1 Tax=Anaeramoeba flamelloides TaxID=1746091 RepID=A0AAV7YYT4_9EUKA|nr:iron-sulfur cluster assembly enzyme iscu [Anaeramoeba flamelloides]|eukprot:Anaeramoba_flamelloidesa571270_320.p1 GENE.a571270_320~~a571270_320.p1  ORF type:complete len:172 (+),score=39.19 a571270_320:64-579(+)
MLNSLIKHSNSSLWVKQTLSWNGLNQIKRFYDQKVVDHFENPRNVGALDKKKQSVGSGIVGALACGDVMRLDVDIDDEGVIKQAVFKTFGCGSAIASSSFATELIKGKSVDEAMGVTNTEIANELSLPPVKLHCSMLAQDAIRAAICNWKEKNPNHVCVCGPEIAMSPKKK